MQLIGLTGGIGSGKSTAANRMRAMGEKVIDVDLIAHTIVNENISFIKQHCPEAVISGTLNRTILAQRLFSDESFRHKLNRQVHPQVIFKLVILIIWQYVLGSTRIILDVPLLFESGFDSCMSFSVVVYTCEKVQLERLCRRDDISVEEAKQRMSVQMPLKEKQARATFVLNNSGSIDKLNEQVDALLKMTKPTMIHFVYWLPIPVLLVALLLNWVRK